jgi:hypothetical protein
LLGGIVRVLAGNRTLVAGIDRSLVKIVIGWI